MGIVRNGYAVAEGIHRKVQHPIETAAVQWVRSNEIMLEDFKFLKRRLLVFYEDLTADPEKVVGEILDFLGLDIEILPDIVDRNWNIHEQRGSIKNMNRRSMNKLTDHDLQVIKSVAGEMLDQFGYTINQGN